MFDDEETIQDSKGERRHGEEVHGGDDFANLGDRHHNLKVPSMNADLELLPIRSQFKSHIGQSVVVVSPLSREAQHGIVRIGYPQRIVLFKSFAPQALF